MGIGLGILLLVLGAVFTWVVQVQIPGIDQYLLGIILMVAGAAVIILSFITGAMRGRATTVSQTTTPAGQAVTRTDTVNNQTEV